MTRDRFVPIHDPVLLAAGERVLGAEFRAMGHPVDPEERRHHSSDIRTTETCIRHTDLFLALSPDPA